MQPHLDNGEIYFTNVWKPIKHQLGNGRVIWNSNLYIWSHMMVEVLNAWFFFNQDIYAVTRIGAIPETVNYAKHIKCMLV